MKVHRYLFIVALMLLGISACTTNKQKNTASGESPAEVNAKLGLAYLQRGNLDVALDKLKKSLEQDSKHAEAHHYIAEVYRRLDFVEEAEKHFATAVKLDPDNAAVKNNYGVFLCEQGDYAQAERKFLDTVRSKTYRNKAEAYENAGLCALRIPDLDKADQYFRKALEITPTRINSLYQMAQLNYEVEAYLKARAFLGRFLLQAQHSADSLWLGIRIERELGDMETVERFSKKLKQDFADTNEARMLKQSEKK